MRGVPFCKDLALLAERSMPLNAASKYGIVSRRYISWRVSIGDAGEIGQLISELRNCILYELIVVRSKASHGTSLKDVRGNSVIPKLHRGQREAG